MRQTTNPAPVILPTDKSKAFDSLHPKLLLKLEAYGLSDPALTLMRSGTSMKEKTEQELMQLSSASERGKRLIEDGREYRIEDRG